MTKLTEILEEVMDSSKITRLAVFDFDGTLVDTPIPEEGKPLWKEKTGTEWPHKGWWGRGESLNMDVFDMEVLPDVINDYRAEAANTNTLVVMLTGRRPKLSDGVEAILKAKGLKFDRYMYNYGGDTLSNKLEQMSKLLKEFPNIKTMTLHDDRNEHIPTFQQWGDGLVKSGRLDDFDLTHVLNEHWTK